MKYIKPLALSILIFLLPFRATSETFPKKIVEESFHEIPTKFNPPSFGNDIKRVIDNITANSKNTGIYLDEFSTTEENYNRLKSITRKINNNGVFLFPLIFQNDQQAIKIKYNPESQRYQVKIQSIPINGINNARAIPLKRELIYSKSKDTQTLYGQKFKIENKAEKIYAISFSKEQLPLAMQEDSNLSKDTSLSFGIDIPNEIAKKERYDLAIILVCKIEPPIIFQYKSTNEATVRYPINWIGFYKILHTSVLGALFVSKKTGDVLAAIHD